MCNERWHGSIIPRKVTKFHRYDVGSDGYVDNIGDSKSNSTSNGGSNLEGGANERTDDEMTSMPTKFVLKYLSKKEVPKNCEKLAVRR